MRNTTVWPVVWSLTILALMEIVIIMVYRT